MRSRHCEMLITRQTPSNHTWRMCQDTSSRTRCNVGGGSPVKLPIINVTKLRPAPLHFALLKSLGKLQVPSRHWGHIISCRVAAPLPRVGNLSSSPAPNHDSTPSKQPAHHRTTSLPRPCKPRNARRIPWLVALHVTYRRPSTSPRHYE